MFNYLNLFKIFIFKFYNLVQSIFQHARTSSPSIIFFDEIDTIVGKRSWNENRYNTQEYVLSMLLNEMDGIEITSSILVIVSNNLISFF